MGHLANRISNAPCYVKSMSQLLGNTGLALGFTNVKLVPQFVASTLVDPHKENYLDVKNMPGLDNHLRCHKHPRQAGLTEFNLV